MSSFVSSADNATKNAKAVLHQLIGHNTTTSTNPDIAQDTTAATDYVGTFLQEQAGATIHYGKEYEYPPGSGKMHKSLVAAWLPDQSGDDKALAFSGHIDVVPALDSWNGKSPFVAEDRNEKITGRGALDLKGQVASLMGTFKAMHDTGQFKQLKRPVTFMLSSCEEVGLRGAKDVCKLARQHQLQPSEVIVIEPTDGYIGLGAKGAKQERIEFSNKVAEKPTTSWPKYFTIEIESKGGHSSLQGASPADPALVSAAVLKRVKALRAKGVPIEICYMKYGSAGNVVGGGATLTIGYKDYGFSDLKHHLENQRAPLSNAFLQTVTSFVKRCKPFDK